MDNISIYPKYACQFCGSKRKLVETLIDDEFVWNEKENRFEPDMFSSEFEHNGAERCAVCKKGWSGLYEEN